MTATPFGEGRSADVYDQGDGTVLRVYRNGTSCETEAKVMKWLKARGVPVPAVHRAEGPELVMDLVPGPTMIDDLGHRPWLIVKHARTMAKLQQQVNALIAPDWMPYRDGVPDGQVVLHLDLHPMNILLSPTGPVLIDWPNASRGDSSFDAAMTYVLMAAFEATSAKDSVGKRVLVETFALARGRAALKAAIPEAVRYRLKDPNVTEGEREALNKMLA